MELVRYIHLNPVRAHMVEKTDNYLWSSHAPYSGGECPVWLTTDHILQTFATTVTKAHRRYREYMLQRPSKNVITLLRQGLPRDDQILGNDDWSERVLTKADDYTPAQSLEQLIVEVCRRHHVDKAALSERSRCRKFSRIRAEIALIASEQGVATITEVARQFGRAHSGLVRSVNHLRDSRS